MMTYLSKSKFGVLLLGAVTGVAGMHLQSEEARRSGFQGDRSQDDFTSLERADTG